MHLFVKKTVLTFSIFMRTNVYLARGVAQQMLADVVLGGRVVLQSEQVVLIDLGMYMYMHMHIIYVNMDVATINKMETMNLKEIKERNMRGFGGRKEKGQISQLYSKKRK